MPSHAVIRNSAFVTYLLSLLYDSWSFPETRFQATTWGLVVHTLFFGSSSEGARRLLHGPSFFYAHSVLAGWLQLTYANPTIDTTDKVERWGVSVPFGLARTFVVHVATVLAHWHLLRQKGGAPRGRKGSASLLDALLRDVGPQLAILLSYKALYPNLATTYGVKSMSNDALHNWQTACIAAITALVLPAWTKALRAGSTAK